MHAMLCDMYHDNDDTYDTSRLLIAIPRCNMALKRSVKPNGNLTYLPCNHVNHMPYHIMHEFTHANGDDMVLACR
jgi:hypothetical protein